MKPHQKRITLAISMIVVAIVVIYILDLIIDSQDLQNRLLGKNEWDRFYGFSIQNIMWIFFFIGIGELIFRNFETNEMLYGIKKSYLPEDEHVILNSKDLVSITKKIQKDTHLNGLASFLKKLIMQFQSSHSVEQTLNMLNAQLEMKSVEIDLKYNMIRYITWFIPTLGFIGTVVGIGEALKKTAELNAQGDTFLMQVTSKLAIAFDTTFLALIMSAILVFLMHIVEGREEQSMVKIGQYSLDNLINKLYWENKNE